MLPCLNENQREVTIDSKGYTSEICLQVCQHPILCVPSAGLYFSEACFSKSFMSASVTATPVFALQSLSFLTVRDTE